MIEGYIHNIFNHAGYVLTGSSKIKKHRCHARFTGKTFFIFSHSKQVSGSRFIRFASTMISE